MKSKLCASAAMFFAAFFTASPLYAKDLIQTATDNGQFSKLLQAVRTAKMEETLKTPGPFTVFAPTDAAFDALPPGAFESLLKPENADKLTKTLSYHVTTGILDSAKAKNTQPAAEVKTLAGQTLAIRDQDGQLKVNDATITQPDIKADNGVIHVVDQVLLPPMPVQPRMSEAQQ